MNNKDRFESAFDYLKKSGILHTQRQLAELMKSTEGNISKALKGDEKVLTDKFLTRFSRAFDGLFSLEWLLNGSGEMLIKEENNEPKEESNPKQFDLAAMMSTFERQLKAKDNQIVWLQSQIEDLQSQLRRLTATRPQPYGTLVADSEFTEVK